MNNNYLFHGKRLDNGEWIEGYFFQAWERTYILWGMTNGIPDMVEVDPSTVGRYSSQTDKSGKKIFDGDILKITTRDSEEFLYLTVCYGEYEDANSLDDDHFIGWYLKHGDTCVSILNGQSENVLAIKLGDVIGNIHDNPELIGGEGDG